MWGVQALVTMIQNITGVPMGAQVKRMNQEGNSREDWARKVLENNDFVASIVDITVDDVCIGQNPFYYVSRNADSTIPADIAPLLDKLNAQFNSVSKWIARDLLTKGVSTYTLKVKEKGGTKIPLLFPVLGDLKYYLNYDKKVVCFKGDKKITDALIFISYDKDSLCEVEGKQSYFNIIPKPIQLSHVGEAAQELMLVERSIQRYRRDSSRVVQFVTVDVGTSQGDKQQDVIDAIAAPLNANSLSLESTASDMFEDQLPVIPCRKDLGKPVLEQHVPNVNIQDMADLDHVLSKLFLAMKVPKSYVDFRDALNGTAVSLIRGDIRYSRMIFSVQSLMVSTVNDAISLVDVIRRAGIEWKLTAIPNPEDDEVISALQQYGDFISTAYDFIITQSESKDEAEKKVLMYEALLGDAASLKSVQMFFNVLKAQIRDMESISDSNNSKDPLGDLPEDLGDLTDLDVQDESEETGEETEEIVESE